MTEWRTEEVKLKDDRPVTLRNLNGTDAPLFVGFFSQVADDSNYTLRYPGEPNPPQAKISERWNAAAASRDEFLLGAFNESELIGHLMFGKARGNHPWCKHVGYFAMMILKPYWGQGLGQKMLQTMFAFAGSVDVTRIEASVRVDNSHGVRLYEKSGFLIEGTRRSSFLINGTYYDEHMIAKQL